MPKFYVQCGPVQMIIGADSPTHAAFEALGRRLQAHEWIYDDPDLTERDCLDHLMLEGLLHLDPVVRVSEQGFDRDDALCIGAPETILRWHQYRVGLFRIQAIANAMPVDQQRSPRDWAGKIPKRRSPK